MKYQKYLVVFLCAVIIHSCKRDIIEPPISKLTYAIAYTSNRDGNKEIYVMNADGSEKTNLSNTPADDWFPKWSRDGEKIAFFSNRTQNDQLFIMDKDGSNQKQLTDDLVYITGYPWIEWSFDNKKIAIHCFSEVYTRQICIISVDGSDEKILGDGHYPNWTRQNKIIFGGNGGINSINPDGTDLIQITDGTIFDFYPVVSPLSDKLVFRSERNSNGFDDASLHIMNIDGTKIRQLTKKDPLEKPSWSPNNSDILIIGSETIGEKSNIYKLNENGKEELLVDVGIFDSPPVFSADGKNIIYSALSETELACDIYIKNLDSGRISKLTKDKGYLFPDNSEPDWNPTK